MTYYNHGVLLFLLLAWLGLGSGSAGFLPSVFFSFPLVFIVIGLVAGRGLGWAGWISKIGTRSKY